MRTQRYVNSAGIPLSVAVFLATDHYDHEQAGISATSLLKPTRQIILSDRLPQTSQVVDVSSMVPNRLGAAIHDGIERAWLNPDLEQVLLSLQYPAGVAKKVKVNPTREEAFSGKIIPVFMEQRLFREIDGVTISGKFDFLAEGCLEDFKRTSTMMWGKTDKHEDYILQGSIYRWLDPELIYGDTMAINFIFRDWLASRARIDPNYPQEQVIQKRFPLLSLEETEHFIRHKLRELDRCKDLPEHQLPRCTDKELWRTEPKFKYYKNPAIAEKGGRSTKNFDSLAEANARLAKDGNVGVIVTVPGQVKACLYCPAFDVCTQKDELIQEGSLSL